MEMNNDDQPNKNTAEFIGGLFLSLVILPTIIFFGPLSIIIWFVLLIAFIFKRNTVAKGMVTGVLLAIFVFLIVCGGLIFGY